MSPSLPLYLLTHSLSLSLSLSLTHTHTHTQSQSQETSRVVVIISNQKRREKMKSVKENKAVILKQNSLTVCHDANHLLQ